MSRSQVKKCDMCGKEIDAIAAKLYLSPILPGGNGGTSFMSAYTHWADLCSKCMTDTIPKMIARRQYKKVRARKEKVAGGRKR